MSASIDTPTRERVLQPVAAQDVREHHLCYCNSAWIVATTHSQAELWARDNLQRRGYRSYLPLMAVRRRDRVLRSMWHTVQRPLFPGYIFVSHDLNTSWRPIYETPGVRRLVRSGPKLGICPEGAVEALQAAQEVRATLPHPSAQWAPGDAVWLAEGAFQDQPAVVLKVGQDMALVSMLMFGHLREVAVQLDCLRPRDE